MISELKNMDCMEYMSQFPDKFFDLACVDPEYGRGEDGGVDRSKYVKQKNGTRIFVGGGDYHKKNWDSKPAGREYFSELFRVSKSQIIWGCNYYSDNFGPGRIVWDKVNDGSDQSSCEIAYCSQNSRVDMVRYMWRGMMQGKSINEGTVMQGNKKLNEKRIHPTQKPVLLYRWIFQNYAQPGFKILDTHLGSGSSRIAAHDMKCDFWSCEIDPEYVTDSTNRFQQYLSAPMLF